MDAGILVDRRAVVGQELVVRMRELTLALVDPDLAGEQPAPTDLEVFQTPPLIEEGQ